ncbi:MAG: hypothetical protein IJY39_01735 [Clostridia bacterium]|nr:hypothetical protein [Clostridia bacterium]
MNDQTADLLLKEERYPNGANWPTLHFEYACPCGKGRIVYERVPGFNDQWAEIKCESCEKSYKIITGCGHLWELAPNE